MTQQSPHIRLRQGPPLSQRRQEPTQEVEEEDDDELVEFAGDGSMEDHDQPVQSTQARHQPTLQPRVQQRSQQSPEPHITKQGTPDRRFKGQRDLPEPELPNPEYRKPVVGGPDEEGIHRTKDGKPDRRFLM